MRKYLILLLFLTLSITSNAQLKMVHYGIEDGLSQGSGNGLLVDKQGFLWIATSDGLNRFDGYEFKIFKHDPYNKYSIGSNMLRGFFLEDDDENIWLFGEGGYIIRFNKRTERFYNYTYNENDITTPSSDLPYKDGSFIDKDNNIWFGTTQGVCRYLPESDNFKRYTESDSSNFKYTYQFVEDKSGNLWALSLGGIRKYDKTNDKFINYPLVNKKIRITDLEEISEHEFLISTQLGLYSFSKQNNSFTLIDLFNDQQPVVYDILPDKNNNYWIASKAGLFLYNNESKTSEKFINDIKKRANELIKLTYKNDTCIWVGTINGLYQFNPNTNKFTYPKQMFDDKHSTITDIFYGIDSLLFVVSNTGLYRYFDKDDNRLKVISPKSSRPISYVSTKNTMWFGGFGDGIFKYQPNQFKFNHIFKDGNRKNTLSGHGVWQLFEDYNGDTWIGTVQAGLNKLNNKTGEFIYFFPGKNKNTISGNWITAIAQNNKDAIWFGTRGAGLNKYDYNLKSFKRYYTRRDKINMFNINKLIFYNDNLLIGCGTLRSSLHILDTKNENLNSFKIVNTDKNNRKNYIVDIENHNDSIFILTLESIEYFDFNKKTFTSYDFDFLNISASLVLDLYIQDNGQFWLATSIGLFKFDLHNGLEKLYMEKDGLANNTVYAILEDDIGNLWLSTNRGISKFDIKNEKFINFDVSDGLQNLEFNANAAYKAKDGKMYFGGVNGYNWFYPEDILKDSIPPLVYISNFRIFNKDVKIADDSIQINKNELHKSNSEYFLQEHIQYIDELNLSYHEKIITIEFTGVNYISPDKNLYRYRLDGFEKEWNYVSANRKFATYSNLPAGKYVFIVEAANSDGIWCEKPAKLKLIVHPPFWKTWWFRILVVLIIAIVVIMYIRLRTLKLVKQKELLEKTVRERTAEIWNQKEEIKSQRDEIEKKATILADKNEEITLQKEEIESQRDEIEAQRDNAISQKIQIEHQNKQITDSINYAKNIQSALLPQNESLKKIFNQHFIFYAPRDIVSGDFYWYKAIETPEGLRYIIVAADCTGHGVPGAFVSMLGISLLNEIVINDKILKADEILNSMRDKVKTALHQTGKTGEAKDGMDMSLCIINPKTSELEFAGAHNPIYIIKTNSDELIELKPDRQPIGIYIAERPFTSKTFKLEKNDRIYMFSDGFSDQFGGDKGLKFKSGRFKKLLMDTKEFDLQKQNKKVQESFHKWKGDKDQLDDVLVMGFELSAIQGTNKHVL